MKAAVFDIETTALEAVGAGVMLCAVIKPLGQREKIYRADEYNEPLGKEVELLTGVMDALSQFDLWIGHNINRFDIRWLRSRAVQLGLEHPYPTPLTYDTMTAFGRVGFLTVPNMIGKPTKRLDHVVDFFRKKQKKTALYPNEHWATVWGNKEERKASMDKLVHHCRTDVEMNAEVYEDLLRYDYRASIKRLF